MKPILGILILLPLTVFARFDAEETLAKAKIGRYRDEPKIQPYRERSLDRVWRDRKIRCYRNFSSPLTNPLVCEESDK